MPRKREFDLEEVRKAVAESETDKDAAAKLNTSPWSFSQKKRYDGAFRKAYFAGIADRRATSTAQKPEPAPGGNVLKNPKAALLRANVLEALRQGKETVLLISEFLGEDKLEVKKILLQLVEEGLVVRSEESGLPVYKLPSAPESAPADDNSATTVRNKIRRAVAEGNHLFRQICAATGIDGEILLREIDHLLTEEKKDGLEMRYAGTVRCYFLKGQAPNGRLMLDGQGVKVVGEETEAANKTPLPEETEMGFAGTPAAEETEAEAASNEQFTEEAEEKNGGQVLAGETVSAGMRSQAAVGENAASNGSSDRPFDGAETKLQKFAPAEPLPNEAIEKREAVREGPGPKANGFAFFGRAVLPPSHTREVKLDAGPIEIHSDVNMFEMSRRDREFFNRLMDLVEEYEEKENA